LPGLGGTENEGWGNKQCPKGSEIGKTLQTEDKLKK